jgi:hypothetical protein
MQMFNVALLVTVFYSVKGMSRRRTNEGERRTIEQAKIKTGKEILEKERKGVFSKKE